MPSKNKPAQVNSAKTNGKTNLLIRIITVPFRYIWNGINTFFNFIGGLWRKKPAMTTAAAIGPQAAASIPPTAAPSKPTPNNLSAVAVQAQKAVTATSKDSANPKTKPDRAIPVGNALMGRAMVIEANTGRDGTPKEFDVTKYFYLKADTKSAVPSPETYRINVFETFKILLESGVENPFELSNTSDIDLIKIDFDTVKDDTNSQIFQGKYALKPTNDWQPLPSLSASEKILSYAVLGLERAQIQIEYSQRDNLYYVKRNDDLKSKTTLSFDVAVPKLTLTVQSPLIANLVAKYKAFTPGELQLNHLKKPYKGKDLIAAINEQQHGACRHRAIAFMHKIQEFIATGQLTSAIKARFVGNDAHSYIEINEGKEWVRCDLGGYAAILNITEMIDTEMGQASVQAPTATQPLVEEPTAAAVQAPITRITSIPRNTHTEFEEKIQQIKKAIQNDDVNELGSLLNQKGVLGFKKIDESYIKYGGDAIIKTIQEIILRDCEITKSPNCLNHVLNNLEEYGMIGQNPSNSIWDIYSIFIDAFVREDENIIMLLMKHDDIKNAMPAFLNEHKSDLDIGNDAFCRKLGIDKIAQARVLTM